MDEKESNVAFDGFLLDRANAQLWRGPERVALPPKPFGVLCYLIERAGELVTKEELLDAVWRNLHVTESSLSVSINAVRLALGDESKAPRYIETVTRRGYRFIAPLSLSVRLKPDAARPLNAPLAASRPGSCPHLWVGREAALATMDRLFERAARGERQIVFVTGEGGIGKTTFAEMLVERMSRRGACLLAGRCIEHFGTDEAFLPLNEALSDGCGGSNGPLLVEMLREHAPTWLAQMPGLIEGPDRAALQSNVFGASRERMLREFCELLEALSKARPWIIVIEDLHWSDFATLDVLSRFAQRDQKAAVMVVVTYRPVDVMLAGHPARTVHQELQIHRRCSELALNKLSFAEIEQYLTLRFGAGDLARALAPMVLRRTGGHPLFVVALVDYFVAQGEILDIDGGWRLAPGKTVSLEGIPRDLQEMIARQIERLVPDEQRLLEAASAVGAGFSAAAVAGGMKRDPAEVEQACEELARKSQVLSADGVAEWPDGTVAGRYVFSHALYQEVLYQRLAPGRRAALHSQLGETLERGFGARTSEIAAVLALHFEEGRDFIKAVRYLAEAAEGSTMRFSNQEADVYLTRALGLVERLPAGENRLTTRMNLLHQRGWVRRSAGDLPGSFADIAVMVACAAEANETVVEVNGLLDLSRFSLYVDRRRCLNYAQQALDKSEALDDSMLKALATGNRSNLNLLLKGWRGDDADRCDEALRVTAHTNDPRILLRRCSIEAVVQFLTSDYRGCTITTQRGQDMAQAIGDVFYSSIFNVLEAFSYLYLGEWRLLRQSATSALTMAERNANRQAAVVCQLSIAWLHAQALDYSGAKRRGEAALDSTVEKNPFNFFLGRTLLAKACLGLRDYKAAFSQFQQIKDKIEIEGISMDASIYPEHYYNLCEYWIETGDLPRAREQALQLNAYVAQQMERTYLALSHCVLARIARLEGRSGEVRIQLAQAIAIVEAAEAPLAAWRVYASAAEFYRQIGELGEAAAARSRCAAVINGLAGGFDEKDPLRTALLQNYAAEARRGAPVSPAVPQYRSVP
jgi:DNA-binding winged helix-turn-helix (wHTH) protein